MASGENGPRGGAVAVDLAQDGLSARVYAAYYGKWTRISEAYSTIYCGNSKKKPNTGIISRVTKKLADAGYLVSKNDGPGWCKWTATLLPIYLECHRRGIELSDSERGMLEEMLGCEGKTAQATVPLGFAGKDFGLSKDEAIGKKEFDPTPAKIRQYLHALVELGIMFVGNRQVQLTKGASDALLDAVKAALAPDLKAIAQKGEGKPAEKANATVSQIAMRLAVISRSQVSSRELPEKIFLFKLLRLLHDGETAEEIEAQIMKAYE